MTDYFNGMPAEGLVPGHLPQQGQAEKTHHLLRHSLAPEERGAGVLMHFEADSVAEAFKIIKKMSQRDLQAKFRAVRPQRHQCARFCEQFGVAGPLLWSSSASLYSCPW